MNSQKLFIHIVLIILCIYFSHFIWIEYISQNNNIITTTTNNNNNNNNNNNINNKMRSLRNLAIELMKEDTKTNSQALFQKLKREYSKYYNIKSPEKFKSAEYSSRFVQTHFDQETCNFIVNTPRWNAVTSGLNWLMMWYYTKTDSMGYIGMGNMFILSTDQYRALFRLPTLSDNNNFNNNNNNNNEYNLNNNNIESYNSKSLVKFSNLLDVGSGCGATTLQLQPLFKDVTATEASSGMIYSLKKKGIKAIYCKDLSTCTELEDKRNSFDVVSCLNVLDRCERPLSLLRAIKDFISPGGKLLLAVVYPFRPYVEFGGEDNQPFEKMSINNNSIEEYICSMIDVLESVGYKTESFTKAPYISEGDKYYDNYVLIDTLYVLSVMTPEEEAEYQLKKQINVTKAI